MTNDERLGESEGPSPRRARDEVQLTLGQIHGVVWLAIDEADRWLPQRETMDSGEPDLTADDLRRAGAEVHEHFGRVHAALNTGAYDEALVDVGLAGSQGQAKRKGLLAAIARFFGSNPQNRNYLARLRGSLKWSSTLIGSITTALKKEVERIPGAAAAAEAIKEILEVLLNATEPSEETQEVSRTRQRSGESP